MVYFFQERSESLQKQLDGFSFQNKRRAHKSKASDKKSLLSNDATDSTNNTISVSETQPSSASETQASRG